MQSERGFILPWALAIIMLVTIVIIASLSQFLNYYKIEKLNSEAVRARYAAELGVARMQAQLGRGVTTYSGIEEGITVQVSIQGQTITAVATGRYRVKQRIQVQIDRQSLQILRWTSQP